MTNEDEAVTEWAFDIRPAFTEQPDGTWRGSLPFADWFVEGPSEAGAREKFRVEFERQQNEGTDPMSFSDDLCAWHLKHPVPGVYAMEVGLFKHLLASVSEAERSRVFEVSEMHRSRGETYTLEDYERER